MAEADWGLRARVADAYAISDDTASIFGVYVAPAARGLGVASGLMHLLLERAATTLHSLQPS